MLVLIYKNNLDHLLTKILILVTPYIGKTLIHVSPTFHSILWRIIDSYGAIQQQ